MSFKPYNSYIFFFYPFFDVGLVSEKKKILQAGELELGLLGVKIEA